MLPVPYFPQFMSNHVAVAPVSFAKDPTQALKILSYQLIIFLTLLEC